MQLKGSDQHIALVQEQPPAFIRFTPAHNLALSLYLKGTVNAFGDGRGSLLGGQASYCKAARQPACKGSQPLHVHLGYIY